MGAVVNAGAMNSRLRPDYLDPFLKVARLLCRADPPVWLAEQLWRWNQWLYRDRRVEEMTGVPA